MQQPCSTETHHHVRKQWLALREHSKEAVREVCNCILRNETFAATVPGTPTHWDRPTGFQVGIQDKDEHRLIRMAQGPVSEIIGYMQPVPPVGKLTTFRYLTSLAAGYGLIIDLDIITAFLNPRVDNPELYMAIPNRWDTGGGDSDSSDRDCGNSITTGAVVRLNEALYGLKQAPQLSYGDIGGFLFSLGFAQSHAEHNLYKRSRSHTCSAIAMLRRYLASLRKPSNQGGQ